ncbi:Uncharacterized protein LOK49_Contig96G00016 [Camellia lanceoleosa]|nr:Uncharacterized protein LOK49_Contig96G00016 [Camellia lanceoleosa]
MKSSLGMLRRFALHKSHGKEKTDYQLSVHLDDLSQASQDMHDMRNCYDSLLSAAAATANSAFEFSESLRDMGTCILEKTALNDDEESCKILSMMGNVQFELQKLVDSYRSHVIQTITTPSESLLSELRTVEEMKRQCDEKRNLYEYMVAQQREKGRSKSEKDEVFTSQQLQAARDEYDEEATLCIFRLKSLKQGQYRSLLTQAARHHAAQLNFFRKGLKSLEAVEPHIRLVMEKQHIDYQLNGLDDGEDGEDEGVNSHETNDDGELSFGLDAVSTLRNSMELDQADIPRPLVSTVEIAEVNLNKGLGEQIFDQQPRVASHSAPIFADKKFDPAERIREMQPSSARKFHSYVLPTPVDAKSSISAKTNSSVLQSRPTSHSGSTQSLWHTSRWSLRSMRKISQMITHQCPLSLKHNQNSKRAVGTTPQSIYPHICLRDSHLHTVIHIMHMILKRSKDKLSLALLLQVSRCQPSLFYLPAAPLPLLNFPN